MLNINAPDIIAIITIGGFLIAAGLAAYLSLLADNWKEVRITTYYLTNWSLLNKIRLTYEVVRRYYESKKVSHIEKNSC